MKIYMGSVWVGSYEITALADTPEKCRKVLISTYHKNFGTFRENGFKNQADWLEYHDIIDDHFEEINLNSAIVR